MMMMEEIKLGAPFQFHGKPDITPIGQQWIAHINEMDAIIYAGKPLYIRFEKGDRKGSIARFEHSDPSPYTDYHCNARLGGFEAYLSRGTGIQPPEYAHRGAGGTFKWDRRRNTVKESRLLRDDYTWLKGYTGPTVWEKFDAKAAKAELLADPKQTDIDNKSIAIGDKVLYINARYGSGMVLSHGVINRFEARADSQGTEIFTIVVDDTGTESKMRMPDQMLYKK